MGNISFKNFVPHLWIVLAFAVVALLFSYPALKGLELDAHDNVSWKAMSKEGRDYYEETGINPLWSNSMFGGMPTYTTYYGEDNNYIKHIRTVAEVLLKKPAYFFFIAMLCFYILMAVLRVNRWVAGIGAIAFAFSNYNPVIIAAGHETKMYAIAFIPAVLAGMILIFRQKYWSGAALFAVAISLLFSTNHFQIIYYALIIFAFVGLGFLVNAIKKGTLKQFAIGAAVVIASTLLGVAPNATAIMLTKEYKDYSIRGGKSELEKVNENANTQGLDKEYAFQWSNGVGETINILVPNYYGVGSTRLDESSEAYNALTSNGIPDFQAEQFVSGLPLYWGPQDIGTPIYFGAIVVFLYILSLFALRSPLKWWLFAVAMLGMVMSWGKNFEGFNYFLFDNLPMLNTFRTPAMTMIIPQIIFAIGAFWMLNEIIQGQYDKEKMWQHVKKAAIFTLGILVVVGFAGGMFFDFKAKFDAQIAQSFGDNAQLAKSFITALQDDRASIARMSSLRSIFFVLATVGVIWALLKDRIKTTSAIIAMAILVVIDIVPTAAKCLPEDKYVDPDTYDAQMAPTPADLQILQDKDPYYRVLDLTKNLFNDAMPALHHKLVGGYHPAKLEIYQDLIERQLGNLNSAVLNMLNTKYIINGAQGSAPMVIPNPEALGNAWFVNEIKWVRNAEDEMNSLNAKSLGDTTQVANAFNPATTAIIRDTYKNKIGKTNFGKDSSASIKLKEYGLMKLVFTSNNSQPGVAVFSDIYYPAGWKATIDGQPVEISRANYVLRALDIPAGQHEIVFSFEPQTAKTGMSISLIGSILTILLVVAALYLTMMKKTSAQKSE